jgi:hypothetical protein
MNRKLNVSFHEIKFRELFASGLLLLSIALLLLGQLAFAMMWIYAWQHGIFPNGRFDDGGRGGPWSNRDELENNFVIANLCLLASFLISLLSLVVKVQERPILISCLSGACWFFMIFTCFMLMED